MGQSLDGLAFNLCSIFLLLLFSYIVTKAGLKPTSVFHVLVLQTVPRFEELFLVRTWVMLAMASDSVLGSCLLVSLSDHTDPSPCSWMSPVS